eukprot:3712282-Rhodomonas_salina.1
MSDIASQLPEVLRRTWGLDVAGLAGSRQHTPGQPPRPHTLQRSTQRTTSATQSCGFSLLNTSSTADTTGAVSPVHAVLGVDDELWRACLLVLLELVDLRGAEARLRCRELLERPARPERRAVRSGGGGAMCV